MTNLNELFSSDFCIRIGATLLHTVWQIGLIVAVLTLLLRAMARRSAAARYGVACLFMALIPVVACITFSIVSGASATSGELADHSERATATTERTVSSGELGRKHDGAAPPVEDPAVGVTRPAAQDFVAAPRENISSNVVAQQSIATRVVDTVRPWLPWLAVAWLFGVLVFSVWNIGGWYGAVRLRRAGTLPASPQLGEQLKMLVERMRLSRPVRMFESKLVQVPIVVGWLRPVILVPVGLIAGMTPVQIEAILAHELAHIRRHDYLVNLLQAFVETLFFYHPAVWWISRRIRVEREHCCDDVAIAICGNNIAYAEALTALEEKAASTRLAMAAKRSTTLHRVRRILGLHEDRPRWQTTAAALLSTVLIASLAVGLAFAGNARVPTATPKKDRARNRTEAKKAAPTRSTNKTKPPTITSWGEQRRGLQCRVTAPVEIEQGMPLAVNVHFRSQPKDLDPGTKNLNAFLPSAFLELLLTNLESKKVISIRPYDPTQRMPVQDQGKDTLPLNGTVQKFGHMSFPLAKLYDSLSLGSYECRVRYSVPKTPTRWALGPAWKDAGFWHGTVTSGSFQLTVSKQSTTTQTILLPKRLRAEFFKDEEGRPRTVLHFKKQDAQEVNVPKRNGHFLGFEVHTRNQAGRSMQGGTPRPESTNPIAEWFEDKRGKEVAVTILVFETAVAAHHFWQPRASGYKVLWKKTF
ncbi:MAG: M56 family metallopeptidase, partial [Planctomycetes bacterium]|nr:M56 family metallopeptidase [Planctomycetota bacterium]